MPNKDKSKFAKRMLESLGWAPGKGLGLREDGRTSPLKVQANKNCQGIGYVQNNHYVPHQDEFELLLSQLNERKACTNSPIKLQHLDTKLKQSKRIINYHKFARGKDLSCRSAKEISAVLGKHTSSSTNETQTETSIGKDMTKYFAQKLTAGKMVNTSAVNNALASNTKQQRTARSDDDASTSPSIKKTKKIKLKIDATVDDDNGGNVCVDLKGNEMSDSSVTQVRKRKQKKRKKDKQTNLTFDSDDRGPCSSKNMPKTTTAKYGWTVMVDGHRVPVVHLIEELQARNVFEGSNFFGLKGYRDTEERRKMH